jgi:hypothetical protein
MTLLLEPNCYTRRCKHYLGVRQIGDDMLAQTNYCAAFHDGIPDAIAYGDNPHTAPFEGDHGIMFEVEA